MGGSSPSADFAVSEPFPDGGTEMVRLRVLVPIVQGVTRSRAEVQAVLADLNHYAACAALTYFVRERVIGSVFVEYLHAGNVSWRPQHIARLALLQLCLAELDADALAASVGGQVFTQQDPTGGGREEARSQMHACWSAVKADAALTSRFSGLGEHQAIAEQSRGSDIATLGATVHGIALEVPFRSDTTLVLVKADEPHPLLGQGLGVFTALPVARSSGEQLADFVASLLGLEHDGLAVVPHVVAWGERTVGRLRLAAYSTFLPNAFFQPGVVADQVAIATLRARWAHTLFAGGPGLNAWPTRYDRMFVEPQQG